MADSHMEYQITVNTEHSFTMNMWTTDRGNTMEESHKHNVEQKSRHTEQHIYPANPSMQSSETGRT